MQWSERYQKEQEPSQQEIREYIGSPLWDDLEDYLQRTYRQRPKLFYSCCGMQQGFWKGWNVKYQKGGKALCTLYPKQGYFVALIAVGTKEAAGAQLLVPLCDVYTQDLYSRTKSGATGKSLALEVTNERILRDVKSFIALRVSSRTG